MSTARRGESNKGSNVSSLLKTIKEFRVYTTQLLLSKHIVHLVLAGGHVMKAG